MDRHTEMDKERPRPFRERLSYHSVLSQVSLQCSIRHLHLMILQQALVGFSHLELARNLRRGTVSASPLV